MPTQKHLTQIHLAAIAHGALREYAGQPQGKSAQSTPNRKRDVSVFVARFNTADGAPRHPWTLIREMFGETRQASHVRVRRVLRKPPRRLRLTVSPLKVQMVGNRPALLSLSKSVDLRPWYKPFSPQSPSQELRTTRYWQNRGEIPL